MGNATLTPFERAVLDAVRLAPFGHLVPNPVCALAKERLERFVDDGYVDRVFTASGATGYRLTARGRFVLRPR